jgi:hypothetical protein
MRAEQSCKVELRHPLAQKAKFWFQILLNDGKALCIFQITIRMFGTNGHWVLIVCSVKLQRTLHLRLLDIMHEMRRDLFFFTVRTPALIAYMSGV